MKNKLSEAAKEITKSLLNGDHEINKEDVKELKSHIVIWEKELQKIDDDLYWNQ